MSAKPVWFVRKKVLMSIAVPLCLASAAPVQAAVAAESAGDQPSAGVAVAQNSLLDRKYEFHISAQKVSSAILELSRQAEIQILMPGHALDAYSAPAVEGQLSLREALGQILANTPGTFRETEGNIVIVELPQAENSTDADPAQAAAAGNAPTAGAQVTQLGDVVVTATKRQRSSRDVPVSLTALRGEDLEKIGARDIHDYLMLAPGLTLDEGEAREAAGRRMTMRGVGPGTGGANQTVGQFVGDAPIGDPYTNYGIPDVDPFDLKTVEVLRGPQGTTFGASALNGAIRYVPNEPVLNEWSGRGFVDYLTIRDGSAGFTHGAALNAPLGTHAAFRASGIMQDIPGVYDNVGLNRPDADSGHKWSGRGAVRWEPTDRISANFMYMKQHTHADDVVAADNGDGRLENSGKVAPGYINFGFNLASVDLRYRLDDWGTVVVQGTRQEKLSDGRDDGGPLFRTGLAPVLAFLGLPAPLDVSARFRTNARGSTQELRLVSPEGGQWDWIVGAFRRDYKAFVDVAVDTDLVTDFTAAEILPLTAKENAFFGELTRRFGSGWEATLGARRYSTQLDGVFVGHQFGAQTYSTPIAQKDHGLSPKFSLSYKASKNLMTYATISRGFQFGGVNIPPALPGVIANYPQTYGSSVLWNREVGVRTDWLDRTLRVDAAVYDIRWSDAQLAQSTGGLGGGTYIDNVGDVSSRGVETTLTWLTPVPGLSASFVGSYVNAKTASAYTNGAVVTPSGTQMPAAPRVQTASTVAYSTYFGSWVAGTSVVYTQWGKAYDDINHTNKIYDFGMVGLNFNASRPDLAYAPALTLGITNLTDKHAVVGRTVDTWTYTRPLAVSLRVSAEFN